MFYISHKNIQQARVQGHRTDELLCVQPVHLLLEDDKQ